MEDASPSLDVFALLSSCVKIIIVCDFTGNLYGALQSRSRRSSFFDHAALAQQSNQIKI